MRKIIISETLDQIRVAVLDNLKLTYFLIDNTSQQASIRGNIYKAKKNLSAKGIEASFVKIDEEIKDKNFLTYLLSKQWTICLKDLIKFKIKTLF